MTENKLDPQTIADLRLRLSQGGGLCLKEHVINKNDLPDGDVFFWIDCGDERIASLTTTPEMLEQQRQAEWMEFVMWRHRAKVAEELVAGLLGEQEL